MARGERQRDATPTVTAAATKTICRSVRGTSGVLGASGWRGPRAGGGAGALTDDPERLALASARQLFGAR